MSDSILESEVEKSNTTTSNSSSLPPAFLAVREQNGRGDCLKYRKIGTNGLQVNRCWDDTESIINLAFQGSCQEALVDAHAISTAAATHLRLGDFTWKCSDFYHCLLFTVMMLLTFN